MASHSQIGAKRPVSGAHYGLRDWLAQRLSATLMAVFTIVLLFWFFTASDFSYAGWASIFARPWMKYLSMVTALALLYHAWVGVRDIWMDYLRSTALRLFFHAITIVWLLACAAYIVQILWSV